MRYRARDGTVANGIKKLLFILEVFTTCTMTPEFLTPSIAKDSPDRQRMRMTKDVRQPLKSSRSLDGFDRFDVTTVVGTEFNSSVQLSQLLSAPNSDDFIRDLALLSTLLLHLS